MNYGRAYIQGSSVVALHASSEPITIVVIEGCTMYDLTLSGVTTYDQLSYDGLAVTGPTVLTCVKV